MRPRLKGVVWERDGDDLRVVYDRRDPMAVADPDGAVEALLGLLREGGRTPAELAAELAAGGRAIGADDVAAALGVLDEHRLVEDGDRLGRLGPGRVERDFSNLAFFESFASLGHSREDFCRRLAETHVLALGTGGLNSNTLPHLCGLGVGKLTLLDQDVVEPRNFARQYFYRWSDIGARKVQRAADWVRGFDPAIEVEAIDARIDGPEQLGELLDRLAPDAVAAGIDDPPNVDEWVNAACVPRGIPFVRGGMWVTEGIVWSVDPGRSACNQCAVPARRDESASADPSLAEVLAGIRLHDTKPRTNRGIGPVAGLLGSFGAFELLRYLTGFEPPAHAARPLVIDFADGCATRRYSWPRDPACPVCGPAALAAHRGEPTTATSGRR